MATDDKPAIVQRPMPLDFEASYVAHGFNECEIIYRASPGTVRRWLNEAGAGRLRAERAAFMARRRDARRALRKMPKKPASKAVHDGIAVPPTILAAAANWLRTMRNGGWFCAATGQGDYWVGLMRKTPAQVVEFAAERGFDLNAANLMLKTGSL